MWLLKGNTDIAQSHAAWKPWTDPSHRFCGLRVAAYSQERERAGQEAKGRDPTAPPGVSCFWSLRVNVTSPSHPFSTR